jgi:hypothetical protein
VEVNVKTQMIYSRHQALGVFVTLILLSSPRQDNRAENSTSSDSSSITTAVSGPMTQTATYGDAGGSRRAPSLGPFLTLILNAQPSDVQNCDKPQTAFALRAVACSGSAVPVVTSDFEDKLSGRSFARQRQLPSN